MDVSIIIVNYNSIDVITDAINSIIEKTKDLSYEIIVVDNASPDNSADIIEKDYEDRVKLIRSDENLGFGKANNLGASYACGKYLFLLNPDTVLINNAVEVLYDFMETHPKAGVAGGNLYGVDKVSAAPSFCLSFPSVSSEKKESSWHKILMDKVKQKQNKTGKPFEKEFNYSEKDIAVAYIFGADMIVLKSLFEETGGFDPDFFMYAEEAELQWRIQKTGYQICNVSSARIVHLEGMSSKQQNVFNEKQFRWRMESQLLFFEKCYGHQAAEQFYNYRRRRYQRLLAISNIHHKKSTGTTTEKMLKCLDEVFTAYKEKYQQ